MSTPAARIPLFGAMVFAGVAFAPWQGAQAQDAVPDRGTVISVPYGGTMAMVIRHPDPAAQIMQLNLTGDGAHVDVGSEQVVLQSGLTATDAWDGQVMAILMDIDFDGFEDVGILDGVGYGGVNFFWSFYRADPAQGLVPVGTIPNPTRLQGVIDGAARSGPFWTRELLDFTSGSRRLIVSRELRGDYDVVSFPGRGKGNAQRGVIPTIAPDPYDPEALEDPAFHQFAISTNPGRAYFYDGPSEDTRRNAYLVEGDEGRVTDADATGQWLYIVFTHPETRVTTTGWMLADDLVLPQG